MNKERVGKEQVVMLFGDSRVYCTPGRDDARTWFNDSNLQHYKLAGTHPLSDGSIVVVKIERVNGTLIECRVTHK